MSRKKTGNISLLQIANYSEPKTRSTKKIIQGKKKKTNSLTSTQKFLRRRILELSFEASLSHLGSCLSAVDIIEAIYKIKKPQDKFVLSNGHAAIAWYVVLEKYGLMKNPRILKNTYIHPDRNPKIGIEVSTGSLGQGLPIALGMAMADKTKTIYCMISDGECAEGSIWEAMRVAVDFKVNNLKIIVNANGWGAYDPVSLKMLLRRFKGFGFDVVRVDGHNPSQLEKVLATSAIKNPLLFFAGTTVEHFKFLVGQHAHYYVMNQDDYNFAMKELK